MFGGLIAPDTGELNVFGTDVTQLNNNQLNELRARMGFCSRLRHFTIQCRYGKTSGLRSGITTKNSADEIEQATIAALQGVGLKKP
jgi:phospholipid/cholesterol/gamma-HCH transport system ATP-binding protein